LVRGYLPISIFPRTARPYGCTYEEWVIRWWQWLLSIPKPKSPAFDLTGVNIDVNQHDPNVFFLCQTIEGAEPIPMRRHTLTSRKAILMPIINWISTMNEDGDTDEELMDVAQNKMNVVATLKVSINDMNVKRLQQYRVRSSFFDVILPHDNIFDMPPGRRRSMSDGYWLFFIPLERRIRLSTRGSCSSGLTTIGVNYDLLLP
jgi:hypothetical protein